MALIDQHCHESSEPLLIGEFIIVGMHTCGCGHHHVFTLTVFLATTKLGDVPVRKEFLGLTIDLIDKSFSGSQVQETRIRKTPLDHGSSCTKHSCLAATDCDLMNTVTMVQPGRNACLLVSIQFKVRD